jgi:general secretion pathway protein I
MVTCISNIQKKNNESGFTLIEVLLALVVIAIALTALLKATRQDIVSTHLLKERSIEHIIAVQAVRAIQLGLIQPPGNQPMTKVTKMFGQKWYWRVKRIKVPMKYIDAMEVTVSEKKSGPFQSSLYFFRNVQ